MVFHMYINLCNKREWTGNLPLHCMHMIKMLILILNYQMISSTDQVMNVLLDYDNPFLIRVLGVFLIFVLYS